MSQNTPKVVGLKKSFGFGDRLGSATPGHLAACKRTEFVPILAQQSIREMVRTQRSPADVMYDAQKAIDADGYTQLWGADADHLKTVEDIKSTLDAGFCFFTFDPSDHVVNEADEMGADELAAGEAALIAEGVFEGSSLRDLYLGKSFEIADGFTLAYDEQSLQRAAVKYGRAMAHCGDMGAALKAMSGDTPFEVEMSVDESEVPTTYLEHLFVSQELGRRDVQFTSLAPRFIGDFEKGVDYRGDVKLFEDSIAKHVNIAKFCGPYKLSLHSGSDKFSVYPIFGRLCGDLLHVKTAGTSYVEALRVVVRTNKPLFKEMVEYAQTRFTEDCATYHISTTQADVDAISGTPDSDLERVLLDENEGRQLMHVTYGSVLINGKDAKGHPFGDSLREILETHDDLHMEFIERHFDKHLGLLLQG